MRKKWFLIHIMSQEYEFKQCGDSILKSIYNPYQICVLKKYLCELVMMCFVLI